jgi:hypothetical protein
MELYELELKSLVEVKLLRLNKPKFSTSMIPLSGSYNSLEDLKEIENIPSSEQRFENKVREFYIPDESSIPIDNMFQLSSSFGKVLYAESLEALLIINNQSDKEIKIKDLKIKVSNEVLESYESMFKKTEYNLVNTSNVITIQGNHFYNQKIRVNADIMCKYALEIDIQYTSYYFNEEYSKHSSNKIIKTISSHYFIETNTTNVVKKYYKKFLFATNLPFKIKEKFINDSMERCFVEINLVNQSPYNLFISEFLFVNDGPMIGSGQGLSPLQEIRNLTMEQDEEVNLVFTCSDYRAFILNVLNFYSRYRIVMS